MKTRDVGEDPAIETGVKRKLGLKRATTALAVVESEGWEASCI